MLFFSFFKTLVNHEVTVELKNDISIRGTLKSVDQYLNIKLDDISVVEEMKYPHLARDLLHHTGRGAQDTRLAPRLQRQRRTYGTLGHTWEGSERERGHG
ncbi:U6 snRNA-associated Sm-like protein LSm2 [Friedmanniomyces endolithicus]|uniref:U6 snRNA-associated Sm-like protein LSm2 n=1 Tax=Friedmanniomyces endolithicus TaxID=329885 RepID=A0AAN6FCA3_9PEZI|nr:U6 snRNA-associated Sm-like protein LSm2 [Friedmanniomyces endolithicus]KAK0290770.1 U6 snRNA-associated Sm-like protein LSm2 [Friedmanniomyces endolithicus]KAK0314191.1 U6 snRNA-associated Sm-like protein LSm2 [Friedmanniomyces endolithicus]KAK0997863.1 U6 snRNA-associated Sm-like protein LSm2 [Friedmanniomyces endolithicus]